MGVAKELVSSHTPISIHKYILPQEIDGINDAIIRHI
jgi:hypothetical protein